MNSSASTSPGWMGARRSVVIGDFDVMGAILVPSEADAVLVVDPDRILPGAVALERLEPVARRGAQIIEPMGGVEHRQFSQGGPFDMHETADASMGGERCGVAAGKATDHMRYVSRIILSCNPALDTAPRPPYLKTPYTVRCPCP